MKILKNAALLLTAVFTFMLIFCVTAEAADIAINSTNFPDSGFRSYIKKEFDKNKDGKLSKTEREKVDGIFYDYEGCTSMKGIEFFPNILWLNCSGNKLTELDISKNTKLENLSCERNQIKTIDIHLSPWLVTTYTDYWDSFDDEGVMYYDYYVPDSDDDEETDYIGYEYSLSFDVGTKVIFSAPKIKTQPKAQKVSEGAKATFKVKAEGGALSYQWYYKKPGAASYKKVAAASGKKATFTVTAVMAKNGYLYRCKVTNAAGTKTSKAVKLTVCALPKITSPTKATSRTVKEGVTTTFTVKATGAAKYQWEFRTSSSGEWKNIAATTGKTAIYKLKVAAKHDGYQYRCKVFNEAGGYVYSKIFTLKVK